MSDDIEAMAAAARGALCGHCRVALPMSGPHHHSSTGFLYWCSVPSEVLALIDEVRRLRGVETAARAYVEAEERYQTAVANNRTRRVPLAPLAREVRDLYAALVKALEGGGDGRG